MMNLLDLPYAYPVFSPKDVEKLILGEKLISKGYAEDLGSSAELQYDLEKPAIRYFIRLFVRALFLGSSTDVHMILDKVPEQNKLFVEEIRDYVEKVWDNITFYQKTILYFSLVNEYSRKDICKIFGICPSILKRQIRLISDVLPRDAKFFRLHEVILAPHNYDKIEDLVSGEGL
jgi:hypothetical protein